MKKIFSKSIQLVSVIMLFASCSKDFIEKEPNDSVPEGEAIIDESSMQNAISGMYANMRKVGSYGRDIPVIGDVQSDNAFIEIENSGRYLANYQFNFTAANDEYTEMWNEAYSTILRANNVIDADITGDKVPALKAQAYATRGLMYFKLVNSLQGLIPMIRMQPVYPLYCIMIRMYNLCAIRCSRCMTRSSAISKPAFQPLMDIPIL